MMPFQIESLSLIIAVQAAVLAVILWAGTYGDAGNARSSLRLRALALGLEAAGWGTLAISALLSPQQLLLGGNALNLAAQAISVIALRMLLNEPLRWRLVVAVAIIGWLGVAWFGVVRPDYRYRVLWGSVAITINMLLNAEALTGGFKGPLSKARNVLLLISGLAVLLLVWRNGQLWLGPHAPSAILVPSATNYVYVMLSGMQPLFASIAFLLLYNEILQQELHLLARIDPLTGVSNRLAIDETLQQTLALAARQQRPLSVLMLDADKFKAVNDRHGHSGGDKVLRALVNSIRATLRESDFIGRVGGEEFVVVSPDTDIAGALLLAERIRVMVEGTPLLVDGQMLHITVSIGVAEALARERDVKALLNRADKALYVAKRSGRNKVVQAESPEATVAHPARNHGVRA